MKSSPVACAPRWTSDTSPVTRPSSPSGTSSCAAELISTHDEPCPTPAHQPGRQRDPERAREREERIRRQVERPREHARARFPPNRPTGKRRARADRAERVGSRDEREAARSASESGSHQLRYADDPRAGRERDRHAEHDDGGGKRRPRTQGGEAVTDSRALGALLGLSTRPDSGEQSRREEERDGVQREEDADRKDRQQQPCERPAADGERVGRGADEPVGLLHVAPLDESGKQRAVRRLEVAGRGREHEGSGDQRGQRQVPGEAGDRDRHEDDTADEIGRDHEPAPVPAVGGDTAVQAEEQRGDAVGEPHGDHSKRPGRRPARTTSARCTGRRRPAR